MVGSGVLTGPPSTGIARSRPEPISDKQLAEIIGRPVERKWRIFLTADDRWFSRLSEGWLEVKDAGNNPRSS